MKLSVNINKIATLRNSRGGNNPDVLKAALDVQRFGANGVTVHPRPDERHIRYLDVRQIRKIITTEFNIEGNCREQKFVDLVLETRPHQVTLVPDELGQITSNHGWDTIANKNYLTEIIRVFKDAGIRTSIFVDPVIEMVEGAVDTGTDRIELYTQAYAEGYNEDREKAIEPYVPAGRSLFSILTSVEKVIVLFSFEPARHGDTLTLTKPRFVKPTGTSSPHIFPSRPLTAGLS